MKLFIAYIVIVNIIGFVLMGVDKKRAIRVPGASRRLLYLALLCWEGLWAAPWACGIFGIKRNTGILNTVCR